MNDKNHSSSLVGNKLMTVRGSWHATLTGQWPKRWG